LGLPVRRNLAEAWAEAGFRIEVVERMSDLRFDLLKWNCLFGIGQLAAITAILSAMLRGVR